MPNLVDHLLIVSIAIVAPIYWKLEWHRRGRALLASADTRARLAYFREDIVTSWLLTFAILGWWFWAGRSTTDIGLDGTVGWTFWIGMAIVVVLAIVLWRQFVVIRNSPEGLAEIRNKITGDSALMIPHNEQERQLWIGVSLTAGICEEIFFRGYLMWYLMTWVPWWTAIPASAVAFGMVHLYLGWAGVLRATAAGVVLGAAYLVTDSLWVPIILHVMIDISSGYLGSAAFKQAVPVPSTEDQRT